MAVSTPFARQYLRQIWADAQASSLTLAQKLSALSSAALANVSAGKTLSGTSSNGRSVQFTVPIGSTKNPSEGVTPTELLELLDRLQNLYDAAVTAGNSTDATRYTYMLSNLVAVRSYRSDYQSLRQ